MQFMTGTCICTYIDRIIQIGSMYMQQVQTTRLKFVDFSENYQCGLHAQGANPTVHFLINQITWCKFSSIYDYLI